jgi:hypothetical protein
MAEITLKELVRKTLLFVEEELRERMEETEGAVQTGFKHSADLCKMWAENEDRLEVIFRDLVKEISMVPVIIESPYAGNVETNLRYLRAAMRDCLLRGEAPYASHGFYTQPGVLDDNDPAERSLGINAGFVWGRLALKRNIYTDRGVSGGMDLGVEEAKKIGQILEERTLPGWK